MAHPQEVEELSTRLEVGAAQVAGAPQEHLQIPPSPWLVHPGTWWRGAAMLRTSALEFRPGWMLLARLAGQKTSLTVEYSI